jgi:hypothetical protein
MARKARDDATTGAWAAVIQSQSPQGSAWVALDTVSYTKRDAKRKYLGEIPSQFHAGLLKNVRFVRVTITETPRRD